MARMEMAAIALVFTCLLALSAAAPLSSPVPLLLWSGKGHFEKHEQVSRGVHLHDVECVFHKLYKQHHACQSNTLSQHLAKSFSTPEVVVAFIFNELGTEDLSRLSGAYSASHGSFDHLKELLSHSSSSLSVSYFYPESSRNLDEALVALTSRGARRSKSVTFKPDSQSVTVEAILKHIADEGMFSNGATDLVLIKFENLNNLAAKDELINGVIAGVSKQSAGNFVATLSANSPKNIVHLDLATDSNVAGRRLASLSHVELMAVSASTNSSSSSGYTGPKYITSSILVGLLMGFFLIFILIVGVNIVMSVESPVRFPRRIFVVKKEY